MSNKDRLKLITGVFLIFFTGMATGHFGTVYYFQNKFFKDGPPPLHSLIRNKVGRELRLSKEQQKKFDQIISDAQKNFDAFRKKHDPEVKTLLTDCFKQIDDILTPEQQKQFKRIKNRFQRRHRSHDDPLPRRNFSRQFLPPPDELMEQLNLTEDQIKHIIPIIREYSRKYPPAGADDRNSGFDSPPNNFPERPEQEMTSPPLPPDENFMEDTTDLLTKLRPFLNDIQMQKLAEMLNSRPAYSPEEKK